MQQEAMGVNTQAVGVGTKPQKIKNMVPKATWVLLEKYEIRPSSDEIRGSREST